MPIAMGEALGRSLKKGTATLMKKLLFLAGLLLLGGCGVTAPPLPNSADDPARVVFATDLHYLSQSLTDNGEGFMQRITNGDGKVTQYAEPLMDAFVAQLLADPPDALVLGGDLTLNGERQSHIDLAAKLKPLREKGVPVLLIPGNHDTDNFMAAGFAGYERELVETVDQKEFQKLYRKLGYDDALSRDRDSLSYLYPVRSDLWILLLDVNESVEFNQFSASTLEWMTKQLEAARQQGATVVSVTHQNLLQHNPHFSGGYVIKGSEQVVALLAEYGVPLNLTGHIHMQQISQSGGLYEAANASLSVTPCQYAQLTFDGDTLDYTTQVVDVSGWAGGQGSTDPALLDFAQTARSFFWDTAFSSAKSSLEDWGIAPDHVQQMALFYADLNTDYFGGKASSRTRDDPAFALWERYEKDSFFYNYITSMLDSTASDHNCLQMVVGE